MKRTTEKQKTVTLMSETKIKITNPIAQILVVVAVVLLAALAWAFWVAAIVLIVVVGLAALGYIIFYDLWVHTVRPWWRRKKFNRK